MLSFSRDPKGYIQDLLRSQSRDLKVKGSPGALDGRQAYREDSERCPPGGWRASGADPAAASQVMTDVAGNPEEERRAEFYHQPWSQEAVSRYFYCKVGRARAPQPPSLREGTPRLRGALPAPRGSSEAGGGWGAPCHSPAARSPCSCSRSSQIQQRRQELEQSLVVRNT